MKCKEGELACNDDSDGTLSEVSVYLAADQTVTLVVTGYSGSVANFVLNVS